MHNDLENLSQEVRKEYLKEMDKAKYEIDENSYLIALETNPLTDSGIAGLSVVAIIITIIIIFTSVFCIKNSFSISITEKIKQYGMLRSVGATKKQIKKNVFYEATILGIIGIPLGILCGFIASYLLVIISNYFLNSSSEGIFVLEFKFPLTAVIISILLGIITIYFSAIGSAIKASKISPIDSIRNSANIKIKKSKLKTSKLVRKIFGIGGEISYKNLKRNKSKYRTTVFSLIISVFVFIALSGFMSMVFKEVKNEIDYHDYNISLVANDVTEENMQKLIDTTALENIEDSSIVRKSSIDFENAKYNQDYIEWKAIKINSDKPIKEKLYIYAVGDSQYRKFIKSLGLNYEDIKDKGILNDYTNVPKYRTNEEELEYKYMRIFDYNVEDKIIGNLSDEGETTFEIGYVTDKKPFGIENINKFILVSDELYNNIFGIPSSSMQVLYKSNNASKLQDDIEGLLKDEVYFSIDNQEEYVNMMTNLIVLVGIFLYGFIVVVSLIGITNIFNTITTSMELRKPEFAMLKSIGMTSKEFKRMIRLESLFIGFKALIFGIPIGIAISYLIYRQFNALYIYEIPYIGIIISIIAVFLIVSLIMKYSTNKINKQNIIETIRNENI